MSISYSICRVWHHSAREERSNDEKVLSGSENGLGLSQVKKCCEEEDGRRGLLFI